MSLWSTLAAAASAIGASGAHLVDRLVGLAGGRPARDSVAFTGAMIALSAKMAKADGIVTSEEEFAFLDLVAIAPDEVRNVVRVFDLAKRDVTGFEVYAKRVRTLFKDEPGTLIDILDGLFHIAKADGYVHEAEMGYLERVAEIFGLGESGFEQIRARHVLNGPDPYKVLGIEPSASDADVKRRYRSQVAESHPDRLVARGVPAEFIKIANDRMAALNEAWHQVAIERGL